MRITIGRLRIEPAIAYMTSQLEIKWGMCHNRFLALSGWSQVHTQPTIHGNRRTGDQFRCVG